jgi:A/G-specific adenine glycosylase
MTTTRFNEIIRSYYKENGRHDMPWRKTRDPYKILISEVMLQQTQVSRVMPFYINFIKKFPDFGRLARAKTSDVLRAWQGLGYNRRAISLPKLSTIILEEFNGKLPRDREALETLPGIGRGTSGSLMAFAFNEPVIFIETNIRRTFIHFFFPKKKMVTDTEIERCIKRTIDTKNPREWYWALMDYAQQTAGNPNRRSAHYVKQSKFKGSDRELRGQILKSLLQEKKLALSALANRLRAKPARIEKIASALHKEGFLGKVGTKSQVYCINN